MKTKVFRRVLAVLICIALQVCVVGNVFAVDLFQEGSTPGRGFRWANRSGGNSSSGYPIVYWVNLNLPNSHGIGADYSNLLAGAGFWTNGTSSVFNEIPLTNFASMSTAYITHSYVSHESWEDMTNYTDVLNAFTDAYSLSPGSYAPAAIKSASNTADINILYAYIYYTPYTYTSTCPNAKVFDNNGYILSGSCNCSVYSCNVTNWSNIVAHETGHALGFGHPDEVTPSEHNTIMRSDIEIMDYTELMTYDLDEYIGKYIND